MSALQILMVNAIFALIFKEHSLVDAKFATHSKFKLTIKKISNEFIIKFHHKYSSTVRESFIKQRLIKANVSIYII